MNDYKVAVLIFSHLLYNLQINFPLCLHYREENFTFYVWLYGQALDNENLIINEDTTLPQSTHTAATAELLITFGISCL